MFVVATIGVGCGTFEEIPLGNIASTSAEISDAANAAADAAPGEAAPTLRVIAIITQSLSALAYAFLGWRLKQDSEKEK